MVLRNLLDSALLTSAAAQGLTDFYRLEGLNPDLAFDPKGFRKARRKEEQRVRPLMTGRDSGLSEATLAALSKWDVLFDDETHGGPLTRAQSTDWLKGAAPLSVAPKFSEDKMAVFINRYCEISWMVHRLLPLAQPKDLTLPPTWGEKWRTLDECLALTADTLTSQLGKPIGAAIVELVQKKFPFDQNSTFWA